MTFVDLETTPLLMDSSSSSLTNSSCDQQHRNDPLMFAVPLLGKEDDLLFPSTASTQSTTSSSSSSITSSRSIRLGSSGSRSEDDEEEESSSFATGIDPLILASSSSSSGLRIKGSFDIPLLIYFALFFAGNYFYSVTNKLAIKAAEEGHENGGFPLTISAVQLGLGSVYGASLWILLPMFRPFPLTFRIPNDGLMMIPVALCSAGSHSASVFGYAHGSVSFVQIVKAAEPVFAAVVSQFLYGKRVSKAKWLCLPIIIGGVVLASFSELNFAWSALIAACVANLIASFRGNETKRLLDAPGIKERIGGAGNQFAITAILGFFLWLPVAFMVEGSRWGDFVHLVQTSMELRRNLVVSAFCYYAYNELRTVTLKKTSAVTGSVANTMKRIIVIVGVALALHEAMGPLKLLGCFVGIGGVFVYSIIDNIFPPKE